MAGPNIDDTYSQQEQKTFLQTMWRKKCIYKLIGPKHTIFVIGKDKEKKILDSFLFWM